MANGRIVAVGLLTQEHVDRLGSTLTDVWPLDETPCFNELLLAIDERERELWRERDASPKLDL